MQNRPPRLTETADDLSAADLSRYAQSWLLTGEIEQHSPRTLTNRREILNHLAWYLKHAGFDVVDVAALRGFLHYCTTGHKEAGGRWGNPRMTQAVSPSTIKTYHGHLRTLFTWLVDERVLAESPMDRIRNPIARPDQVQPYTRDEIMALIGAAKRTKEPSRDEAICLFLLDTGVRASELIHLTLADLDIVGRRARVVGKGDKARNVSFQGRVARALWQHLRRANPEEHGPVFQGQRGPLTRSGLLQLVERWGAVAGVVDAHPHRFRHTFAIEFLRGGGDQFTLMQILGHTHLQMTQRYVALAQADIEVKHRRHSPVERLLGKER